MGRDSTPHGPSCAKRIRQDGAEQGWPIDQVVLAIHKHCSVSKLRAQRSARGLTQKEVADRLRRLAAACVERVPRADSIQLGHWETGRHQPRPGTIGLLCQLYKCAPDELGFESPVLAQMLSPSRGASLRATHTASLPVGGGSFATEPFADRVDAARRSVDRTLAASSVSPAQLDLLDERVLWVRQQYVYTPPEPMLGVLLDHLDEVKELAADRQPASVQVRLSELTALLSTLIADSLMKLGSLSRSRAWYDTARNAADDSGNTELRARVRAQAAMLPFYYGPLEAAVSLSREARMICRGRPTSTGAFAAAAEARALAKLGDVEGAEAAIRYANAMFEQSEPGTDNDAFAFPERRLLLYLSGTYTALGRTSQARRVQAQALELYPARTGIDPALLRLEAAIGLARDRSPAEACELAGATYLQVLPAHRTPIVEERAREVILSLPPATRGTRAARELHEILALPPGQM
jgi:transcriptional regulator with XRE-family HTH domain